MKNISQIIYDSYSDKDKNTILNSLYAIKGRLSFGNEINISNALRNSSLNQEAKFLFGQFMRKHLPAETTLPKWLYINGIDVLKYPQKDYKDYCIRWINHIILSVEKKKRCLRHKNLSNSEFLPTRN